MDKLLYEGHAVSSDILSGKLLSEVQMCKETWFRSSIQYEYHKTKMLPSHFLQIYELTIKPDMLVKYLDTLWKLHKSEDERANTAAYIYVPSDGPGMYFPFCPSPPAILMKIKDLHVVNESKVNFRNDDTVPRVLKLLPSEASNFRIVPPVGGKNKIAPGMSVTYTIQFQAVSIQDHYYEVNCLTDRGFLVIPIFVLGPRGVLDFPDRIDMPLAPVRYTVNKLITLRNIGDKEARFSLLTKDPFQVSPNQGAVAVQQTLQMEVSFHPTKVGEFSGVLTLTYDTGEDIVISIHGACEDVNIRLDKNSLHLPKAFVGQSSQRVVTIFNNSTILSNFVWKAGEKDKDQTRIQKFGTENVIDAVYPGSAPITSDGIFHAFPVAGELWPQSTVETVIYFRPEDDQIYETTVYCEVLGREASLVLKLTGEGKGPLLAFKKRYLDVGELLINMSHSFEILLENLGEVLTAFRYKASTTVFGKCCTFIPQAAPMAPYQTAAISIVISGRKLGTFCEEFEFEVEGSKAVASLAISGKIIAPKLSFNSSKIDAGQIACGYRHVLVVNLTNNSSISVIFHLRVIEETSVYFDDIDSDRESPPSYNSILSDKDGEIGVIPINGTIDPNSVHVIKIVINPKTIKLMNYLMLVDVQGVGKNVGSLFITAESVVTDLIIEHPFVALDTAFISFLYNKEILLKNEGTVPAVYRILPQKDGQNASLLYQATLDSKVIMPNTVGHAKITIIPQRIGYCEEKLTILLTGNENKPFEVVLSCTGCGPVVDIQPEALDWGTVPVLMKTTKILTLQNLSPISANFIAQMVNTNSVWKLEPSQGVISEKSRIEVQVTAYFQDTQRFQDKISIKISGGATTVIPVSAKAFGSTVTIQPPLPNPLELPPQFSNQICQFQYRVSNLGKKTHQLMWVLEPFPPPGINEAKKHGNLIQLVFQVIPPNLDLQPGCSSDIIIQGYSTESKSVTESLVCYSCKGRTGGKEIIFKTELRMDLINPCLEFSTNSINFSAIINSDELQEKYVYPLYLKNITSLMCTAHLFLKSPFQVMEEGAKLSYHTILRIPTNHTIGVLITFNPFYKPGKFSSQVEEDLVISYYEHPQIDTIKMKGEVLFPNLEFSRRELRFNVNNGSEMMESIDIINISPMELNYKWKIYVTERSQQPPLKRDSYQLSHHTHGEEIYIYSENSVFRNIEEEWDKVLRILPVTGTLKPKGVQNVLFFCWGESSIYIHAEAICSVHRGPRYVIDIVAKSSELQYTLHPTNIYLENEVFTNVVQVKSMLSNKGNGSFSFSIRSSQIRKTAIQKIKGKTAPDTLNLKMPFDEKLQQIKRKLGVQNSRNPVPVYINPDKGRLQPGEQQIITFQFIPMIPWEYKLSLKVQVAYFEPRYINIRIKSAYPYLSLYPTLEDSFELHRYQNKVKDYLNASVYSIVFASLDKLPDNIMEADPKQQIEAIRIRLKSCFEEYYLPVVHLNFGYVILGNIVTKELHIFNNSQTSLCFRVEHEKLAKYGFHTDVEQVRCLPPLKGLILQITFDPKSASIPVGEIDISTVIKVRMGPSNVIHLSGIVTMPTLILSDTAIDFGDVQCSQCQITTIQLFNNGFVPCEWNASIAGAKRKDESTNDKDDSKHPSDPFEVMPLSGILLEGQTVNVEIKFQPLVGRKYSTVVTFNLSKSSMVPQLSLWGTGLETILEFPKKYLQFNCILPYSGFQDRTVKIKNPSAFPIEIYAMDHDQQFSEEDRILRVVQEYDKRRTILLPPREAGLKIPSEFYTYYEDLILQLEKFLVFCHEKWTMEPSIEESTKELIEPDSVHGAGSTDGETPTSVQSGSNIQEVLFNTLLLSNYDENERTYLIKYAEDMMHQTGLWNKTFANRSGIGRDFLLNHISKDELEELLQLMLRVFKEDIMKKSSCNPVKLALEKYINPIKFPAVMDRSKFRLHIIVINAPLTDLATSEACEKLSQYYGIQHININEVIIDAVRSGQTPAEITARDHLISQHSDRSDDSSQVLDNTFKSKKAIKVSVGKVPSKLEIKMTMPLPELSSSEELLESKLKFHVDDVVPDRLTALPIPIQAFLDILTERLKRDDCKSGVIIDGIPTSFFPNINLCCLALLKIIGDKKYIYVVTMDKDYNHLKDIEEELAKEAEIKRHEQEEEERKRVNSMAVDEYRHLSELEREHVDSIMFQMKLEWLKSIKAISDKDEDNKKKKQKWKDDESQKKIKLKPGRDEGHMETKSVCSDSLEEDDRLPRLFYNFRMQFKELEMNLEVFDRVAGISELPIDQALVKTKKGLKDAKSVIPAPAKKKDVDKMDEATLRSEEFTDFGIPVVVLDLCAEKPLDQMLQMLIGIFPPIDVLREELGLNDQALYRPPPYKLSVVGFPPREITAQPSEHFVFVDWIPSPGESMSPTPSFSVDAGAAKKKRPTVGAQSLGVANITAPLSKRKISKALPKSPKPRSDHTLDLASTPVSEPAAEDVMRSITDSHRWVVPSGKEILLHVRFQSNDIGLFDQVLQFETMGNRRQYRIFCRGLCYLPEICRLPEIVFRNYTIVKTASQGQILRKVFLQSSETFHFGPLLLTQEGPDNPLQARERQTCDFVIQNNSSMPVNISFFLMRECLAYEISPVKMKLLPGETDQLHVSVNAIGLGTLEDRLLCCIQDNPEPYIIKLASVGTIPELELDRRSIQFNHVLLHRREVRKLTLTNKSQLPLLWYLVGSESFGEDFSFPLTKGKLEALSSIEMPICFHSSKPVSLVKKPLKMEISDADRSLGIIQTEMINISVEAYDVMVDLTFSKVNADNALDFGIMKVDEERRETITLRNKGKFDVNYSLVFVDRKDKWFNYLRRILVLNPLEGKLGPFDKNTVVTVSLQSSFEIAIDNEHILDCLIMDPMVDEGREVIGKIPLRFSLKTFFSRFVLNPESGIHFGAIAVGSKVTQSFTLTNVGYFDFSYIMYKKDSLGSDTKIVPLKETKSTLLKGKSGKGLAATGKLQLEYYSVTPSGGIVNVDETVTFLVECAPENLGLLKEDIIIDISDLNSEQYASGVVFSLNGEACIPEININNKSLIFEEHSICFRYQDAKHILQTDVVGVYSLDENIFTFRSIPLQKSVQARFNIFNNSKVPCELMLILKPSSGRKDQESAFKIQPEKVVIPPFQDIFAAVTFSPTMLDRYVTTFIAHIEGIPPQFINGRLSFDIQGEGILPTVTVTKPLLHNRLGHTVITFHQVLVGQSAVRFFQIKNTGLLPCYVTLDLNDSSKFFTLQPTIESFHCFCKENDNIEEACDEEEMMKELRSVVNTTFFLNVNETADFKVIFEPEALIKCGALIKLSIHDNPYETISIKLYGEGFTDDIIIRVHQDLIEEYSEKREVADNDYRGRGFFFTLLALFSLKEIVEKLSYIRFGECSIHETKKVLFTMTNSLDETIRFEWEDHEHITIIPQTGHLRGNSSKDFQLNLCFEEPGTFIREPVKCLINSIFLNEKLDDDWDDRKKLLKWGKRLQFIEEGSDSEGRYLETKSFDIEPEPGYEIIPGTQRTDEITISAFADYCLYVCDTSTIRFSDTFVFESRNVTFTLENVSRLYLECFWNIMMLKTYRKFESTQADRLSEFIPFSVHPPSAVIEAGSKMTFTVTFTPLEAEFFKAKLYSSIPNLSPTLTPPEISLDGQGLVPCCHFELEDSDYITKGRRDSSLPVPHGISLENRTKVLELSAVGTGKKAIKKFNIVNPSDKDRPFIWTLADASISDSTKFTCLNPSGILKKGKKTEITFQFEGRKIGTEECGWIFSIPEFGLTLPFLLVGHVREPEVFPEKPSITFKRIMKGSTSSEIVYLCNHEPFPLHFEFDISSCTSEDLQVQLEIVPLKGILPPKSRFQLKLKLTAISEGEYCLNLTCKIERRTVPLMINVRAQVFVSRCVVCVNEEGSKTEVFPDIPFRINMGETEVNNHLLSSIHILNNGSINFELKWILPSMVNDRGKKKEFLIQVNPAVAYVKMNEAQECEINLCFSKVSSITDEKLTLKIMHGPTYIFLISGSCNEIDVRFSQNKIAFGPHFVLKPGMTPIMKYFTVKNPSNKSVSFDCLHKPSSHLTITLEDNIIEAGQSKRVQVGFFPAEVRRYKDTVVFVISETIRKTVEVLGEGVALKLDVDHPSKILKLGAVRLGKIVKKRITVTNYSKLPVTASFHVSVKSPPDFPPECLTVWYGGDGFMPPQNGKYHLHVTFAPKMRIHALQAEVVATVDLLEVPLIILQGCCQAMEVSLINNVLNMGVVAEKCVTTRKLIMNNTGDFGTSFKWEKDKLLPNFSIVPDEGYLLQRQQVVFNVNFHPTKIGKNIACDNVKCILEQGQILYLTLSGACIQVPPSQTVIQFSAVVRQTDVQSIVIQNTSRNPWKIQPILTGEYWSGAEVLNIKPLSSISYELAYNPLTMTKDGKEHKGSLYIAFPDGTAVLHNLSGIAESPRPIGIISRDIQCRTEYKELLTIENWLSYNHRFQVVIDYSKERAEADAFLISGGPFIDVPAKGKKDYKIQFFGYKEVSIPFKVIFKSDQEPGEYEFYELHFHTYKAGPVSSVRLQSRLRQSTVNKLSFKNPLQSKINLHLSCTLESVTVPSTISIPADTEIFIPLEYSPLKIEESQGILEIMSPELGQFIYNVYTKSVAAAPEKGTIINAYLGTSTTTTVRTFNPISKQRVEYIAKVDHTDFQVEKTIIVPIGASEVSFDVTFDPTMIGETKANVTLTSTLMGDFVFPLIATCHPPKPQGPISIKVGTWNGITYRNPFNTSTTFVFQVDNPQFILQKSSDVLKPRKDGKIMVNFEPWTTSGRRENINSKLMITSATAERVQWIYYLKGVFSTDK